jgi:hypothetical protein
MTSFQGVTRGRRRRDKRRAKRGGGWLSREVPPTGLTLVSVRVEVGRSC